MDIAFFGSSLVSAYWNGAATYYRGLIRALDALGYRTTFYEPDAYDRQQHRDMPEPPWANVCVYPATTAGVEQALEAGAAADLIVKASGVGVFDDYLEQNVLSLRRPSKLIAFWDVDAPATLARLQADPKDPFAALVPQYDLIFTSSGGPPVVEAYRRLGAKACIPIYNALDPTTHFPIEPVDSYRSSLAFLGNRLPDREQRVLDFLIEPARRLPSRSFILGGSGWEPAALPSNVRCVGHVYTEQHNAFYSSPDAVLNVSRDSMARAGYSPATRFFEATGAGACLITDAWEGIECFLEPDEEILVAHNGDEVAEHLERLHPTLARDIGQRARRRVLAEHTYAHRAQQVDDVLQGATRTQVAVVDNHDESDRVSAQFLRGSAAGRVAEQRPLDIVVLGLSITSSWGNGHATTYRALIRELDRMGHRVLFLERDVPWYAALRDLPAPPYGQTELYSDLGSLRRRFSAAVRQADLVMVGSFVPDGTLVGDWVLDTATGVTAFYDIDTPVTLAQLESGHCDYLSRGLIPRYQLYLSFCGGPTLRRLERDFGAARARPLYCSVDPKLYFPEARDARWDLGYMGTYSDDRQPTLERLLLQPATQWDDGRFVVAGPSYPPKIEWPPNVERIEHLSPGDHRSFYNEQRFTLNVTRADMIRAGYSPSVRLFEAAAAGTPIITDRWEGLGDFFEVGSEIAVVDHPSEVLALLRDLPEGERRAMGQRARARVLREHTAAVRATTLVEYVRDTMTQFEKTARSA